MQEEIKELEEQLTKAEKKIDDLYLIFKALDRFERDIKSKKKVRVFISLIEDAFKVIKNGGDEPEESVSMEDDEM